MLVTIVQTFTGIIVDGFHNNRADHLSLVILHHQNSNKVSLSEVSYLNNARIVWKFFSKILSSRAINLKMIQHRQEQKDSTKLGFLKVVETSKWFSNLKHRENFA